MWTELLAGYAAVVSTVAVVVTYRAYRSGGPRLSGMAQFASGYDVRAGQRDVTLYVHVYNRGRGAITIDGLMLWAYRSDPAKDRELLSAGSTGWPLVWTQDFPIRLEGHSGQQFSIPAHNIAKTWLTRQDLKYVEVLVDLATGLALRLPVETAEIDDLDPEELPGSDPQGA